MTRRGLGRGLEALLSTAETADAAPTLVSVEVIRPNPYQPRTDIDETGLEELAASIRRHGVIQPLAVSLQDGGEYVLIAGERRLRAARLAGLEAVPVVVRSAEPSEMLALAIIENVQRTDLDPVEAALGFQRLMDEFGLTQLEVAEIVGRSRSAVANTMRLLGLDDVCLGLLKRGQLSEGHARALLVLEDVGRRQELASAAASKGWSVRRLESAVRASTAGTAEEGSPRESVPAAAAEREDPNVRHAVSKLEEVLGTRVEIRRKGDGGQLVVHFYSDEELQALYARLVPAEH